MNVVISWILKFTRECTGEVDSETGRMVLKYNEQAAFYIFLHIRDNLKYRFVYDETMSKCRAHLDFLTQFLESTFPDIYNRIIEECDIDLAAVFTSTVLTAFVGDLQTVFPEIATHIFDVFLCDGECLIFILITKFITLQQDYMMDIVEDADFLNYIMYQLTKDCLDKFKMYELLELEKP
jgi:hypothetical protein